MNETKEEVIKSIFKIEDPVALEKVLMFLTGMIAQQTIEKENA